LSHCNTLVTLQLAATQDIIAEADDLDQDLGALRSALALVCPPPRIPIDLELHTYIHMAIEAYIYHSDIGIRIYPPLYTCTHKPTSATPPTHRYTVHTYECCAVWCIVLQCFAAWCGVL